MPWRRGSRARPRRQPRWAMRERSQPSGSRGAPPRPPERGAARLPPASAQSMRRAYARAGASARRGSSVRRSRSAVVGCMVHLRVVFRRGGEASAGTFPMGHEVYQPGGRLQWRICRGTGVLRGGDGREHAEAQRGTERRRGRATAGLTRRARGTRREDAGDCTAGLTRSHRSHRMNCSRRPASTAGGGLKLARPPATRVPLPPWGLRGEGRGGGVPCRRVRDSRPQGRDGWSTGSQQYRDPVRKAARRGWQQ